MLYRVEVAARARWVVRSAFSSMGSVEGREESVYVEEVRVSTHLACLRDCGLVEGRIEGRQVFYCLARPELLDMLTRAEALLAATGEQVALCPRYGEPA